MEFMKAFSLSLFPSLFALLPSLLSSPLPFIFFSLFS